MSFVKKKFFTRGEPAPSPDMLSAELAPLCSMHVHATSACFNMSWLASLLQTKHDLLSGYSIGGNRNREQEKCFCRQ
jgi:hypothetical protein